MVRTPSPSPSDPPAAPAPRAVGRRQFLAGALAAGGGLATVTVLPGAARPAFGIVRRGRPTVAHGVQSGDVSARSAVVWARADVPARLFVEVATSPGFSNSR
ncbi:MAG TPA: PhoD-like phosphatase N-terminal domain-containing protein, partial [Acidimicrobiales bacterium]|nr:PhoD-like phosphatase N-terminal domain-containing protein [Acidimicrobiales bacterium]